MQTSLTLVLVTEGPARLVAPILAERFAHVQCQAGSVLVGISRRETPESVLAFCRERRIGIVASCVVSRTVHPSSTVEQGVFRCTG
ncbi:MAG TPA: hypothetical protein VNL98_11690 [Gemmatimonadales bacterium]|nr:hypothetical protein [Gemmatimonadales bacterium]